MSVATISSPSKATVEAPLTISSVLNSLHTHLQTQTQLLPTLHAQLGLPQTALADELSALQQRLADTVEKHIETRREEVEGWMRKCDEIERDCLRLTRALGGNTKATGASVGELRKQQVLPLRHEMLHQYSGKLNQLYATKLEQLTNLTNKFSSLSRVLGSEFFPHDITELCPAHGENVMDAGYLRDVTPERFSKLEKELVRGKGEITRRLTQLSETFLQMDWLYDELEISPPECDEPISLSRLNFQRSHSSSSSPTDPFFSSSISVSTPTPVPRKGTLFTPPDPTMEYSRIFTLFSLRISETEAEGKASELKPLVAVEGVEPTVGLLRWAEQTKAELEEIKRRRETQIQAMFDQLETLWKRLGVEDVDIDEFVENHRGSTEAVVLAYEGELERMLELKRERMSVFISNAREEIAALWDELMVGEDERADFAAFADDEHTEDLLTLHEDEIRRLKEERRAKAPLLASIKKYFDICDEEKELAAASQDQSRLLGRGPRDPGRLLREEKMRKRVQREKPRLEHDLLHTIPAWEEEYGRTFLVNSTSIVELLMETVAATDKENSRKKPRAGSVPPRSRTPGASSDSNSGPSHGRANSVTPAVRPASSMSNSSHAMPNKRQRTDSVSVSSGKNAHHDLPHTTARRAPLGSSTASNTDGMHAPSTAHKGRTPSSSLPRPATATATKPSGSGQALSRSMSSRGTHSAGIGLGHPSSTKPTHQRAISAAASYSSMGSSMNGRGVTQTHGHANSAVKPKHNARKNRRESFRPRPSMDGPAGWLLESTRYGGFSGSAVQEEDENE